MSDADGASEMAAVESGPSAETRATRANGANGGTGANVASATGRSSGNSRIAQGNEVSERRALPLLRRWRAVEVSKVVVPSSSARVDREHVDALRDSFEKLGGELQIQPIVVDDEMVLIDGAHRLEAAKQLGWRFIAAVVFESLGEMDRALIASEANRVRKQLSVLDLEQEWRTLYAPELERQARQRQLAGLSRKRAYMARNDVPRPSGSGASTRVESVPLGSVPGVVIGNSNNHPRSTLGQRDFLPAESLAKAAKRITGFSIDTLNKVAAIRKAASSEDAPVVLQNAARYGLQQIAASRASVDAVHRRLRSTMQQLNGPAASEGMSFPGSEREQARVILERLLTDSSLLADRVAAPPPEKLNFVWGANSAESHVLEGIRTALTQALAHVVALESLQSVEPRTQLARISRHIGGELSQIATSRLSAVSVPGRAEGVRAAS